MPPHIHIAFTDDWELRGNGAGNPRVLQFESMRRLLAIYKKHGIVGSFNTELMQQITFRKLESRYPELQALANEWENMVRQAFQSGHDIQPHLHPQWTQAEYLGDLKWELGGDWSILTYQREQMLQLIDAGCKYLERVLRPIDPGYKCVSHRSGSWAIAPSPHALSVLVELGFVFDMSICDGVHFRTRHLQVDYRQCDEGFVPYYPRMDDARRMSTRMESIISVPTFSFTVRGPRLLSYKIRNLQLKQRLLRFRGRVADVNTVGKTDYKQTSSDWIELNKLSKRARLLRPLVQLIKGQHFIADLSQLDLSLMDNAAADPHKGI